MWTCNQCNAEVDDKFENCTQCGTGRDGSAPPVDFVKKKDALQPGLPAAKPESIRKNSRLLSIIIVLAVIAVLLYVAFGG